MRTVLLLLIVAGAGCAQTKTAPEIDVFGTGGATEILRADTPKERRAIGRRVEFLHRTYGYVPDGSHRDLRDLRDLLDHEELWSRLPAPEVRAFGGRLVSLGYSFKPRHGRNLVAGTAGPTDLALADREVVALLGAVAAADLLHDDAGRDALLMAGSRAKGLFDLAARPDGLKRISAFAAAVPYRFRPSDAGALAEEVPLTAAEGEFITWLSEILRVEIRPGQLPELRALAAREAHTRELIDRARALKINLGGAGAIIVLARILRDYTPLTDADQERLHDLAGRLLAPTAVEYLTLIPLCRAEGIVPLVDELEDRHHYRFDPRDGAGLISLLLAGLPTPVLPPWITLDRVSLIRPELLLAPEPATAFTGVNDLRLLEALARVRPELAAMPRGRLERTIRTRLRGREVRYRLGAPYAETTHDLSGFLRPDLLKILLLLDELERPEVVALIAYWMRRDAEDPRGEMGGYVRLTSGGRLGFELFTGNAGTTGDDRLLLPPDPAGAALDFHFHATDPDDSAYAGPSSGGPGTDLFRAAHHRVDGVVFTRLPDGRYNADMYTSRKCVLDLGVLGGPPHR